MEIQVAVAKIGKYATSESGDTLEMIERPHGGLSLALVDGQRSGKAAKTISNIVARKVIALLGEGVRDGAAARAAHDYLYAHRGGKVSATLNIVSVDMETKTLVISRNSHAPVLMFDGAGTLTLLDDPSPPVGVHRNTKPQIHEFPLALGMIAVVFTDGISGAGERYQDQIDVSTFITELYECYHDAEQIAQPIADALLNEAVRRDQGRPTDDISVLVLAVVDREIDEVRRMNLQLPIPPLYRP